MDIKIIISITFLFTMITLTTSDDKTTITTTATSTTTVNQDTTSTALYPHDFIHSPLACAINVVFQWADAHFPLAVRILQVTKTMSDTEIENVPGMKIFLEILAEAVQWHNVKGKLQTGKDMGNHSLEKVIEEFSKHHNYSFKDIPILTNLTDQVTRIPAVKDLVKTAMVTQVNGVPFALTLVFLMQHIGTQIPINQFGNHTVREELWKNISKEFVPFAKIHFNRTIIRLKNSTHQAIANITNFSDVQVRKAGEVAANISDHLYNNLKNITSVFVNYGSGTMNRTKILQKLVQNMTDEQWQDLKRFFNRTKEVPGKFFENPINGFTHMSNNVMEVALSSLGKVANFTQWLNKLTWSHLEDIGTVGKRSKDIAVNNLEHQIHFTMGVARHVYDSAVNLTELTMNMSPIQMFKFKSVDDLVKSRTRNDNNNKPENKGFFTSIPVVGGLPGVNVIQSLFDKFPQFSFLNFNQIMNIFEVFRSKN